MTLIWNLASLPVKHHSQGVKVRWVLQEGLELGGAACRREPDGRGSRHPVLEHDTGGATGLGNGLAPAVRAGDEAALGGGHWYVEAAAVEQERAGNAHGKLDVPHRQLAALAEDGRVVEAVEREPVHVPPGDPAQRLPPDPGGPAAISQPSLEHVGRDLP